MAPEERIKRQQEAKRLVQELGSYSAAARELGISRQRVHELVGKGIAHGRRPAATCIDCEAQTFSNRPASEVRCKRCQRFLTRYKRPWTPPEERRTPRLTHCQRGHAMTEENIYTCRDGRRKCRACMHIRYQWRRADPVKRARDAEYLKEYRRKKATKELGGL